MNNVNIKKITNDIKIHLSIEESLMVTSFIENHIKFFESFNEFDTTNIEILSFPYERTITLKALRSDEEIPFEKVNINSNSSHIKNGYFLYGKDNVNKNPKLKIIAKENNSILKYLDIYEPHPKNKILKELTFASKDNISIKGEVTTASTLMLENFIPSYSATIIQRLLDAGAKLKMKTNLDELAMGGTGTFSPFGIVPNPQNEKHIIGGSSSGSAYVVAKNLVDFSLGSDTGDSIRKPAAKAGIIGYKPTWGIVSRSGLFDYSPSLDHIGWFSKNIETIAKVYDAVVGEDKNDFTSITPKEDKISNKLDANIKGIKIGIFPKSLINFKNKEFEKNYNKTIEVLELNGNKIMEINFDKKLLMVLLPVYQAISFSEATSCNFNLQGINFGNRGIGEDVIKSIRTSSFGIEVKKRFAMGSFMLQDENQEKYFRKAKKIRRLILNEYNKVMKDIDVLLIPSIIAPPPLIEDVDSFETWDEDNFIEELLLLGNFTGCPSITVPNGKSNEFKTSINIMGKIFEDLKTLKVAKFIMEKNYE